jgi:hypothetical protein
MLWVCALAIVVAIPLNIWRPITVGSPDVPILLKGGGAAQTAYVQRWGGGWGLFLGLRFQEISHNDRVSDRIVLDFRSPTIARNAMKEIAEDGPRKGFAQTLYSDPDFGVVASYVQPIPGPPVWNGQIYFGQTEESFPTVYRYCGGRVIEVFVNFPDTYPSGDPDRWNYTDFIDLILDDPESSALWRELKPKFERGGTWACTG